MNNILQPDDFAGQPYVAGLNQIGHMAFGGALVVVFGLYVAAFIVVAIELWQYYRRGSLKSDTIMDTAFWAYGMAFYAAWWFLPSVIIIGGAWMGLVWYMSK